MCTDVICICVFMQEGAEGCVITEYNVFCYQLLGKTINFLYVRAHKKQLLSYKANSYLIGSYLTLKFSFTIKLIINTNYSIIKTVNLEFFKKESKKNSYKPIEHKTLMRVLNDLF